MRVSVSDNKKIFKPQDVGSLHELGDIITRTNWSCGTFKDNHRNIENFISSNFMALDIDEGCSIEEAARRLKPYSHIIAPSKSHKREKNGVIADRFRIVVVLDEEVNNKDDYYQTYAELMKLFPEADKACKDPSRFFYPSKEIYSVQVNKDRIKPKKYVPPSSDKPPIAVAKKGQLSRPTLDFLQFGAPAGTRHGRLYKATKDALENNYTKEEFIALVDEMITRTKNWASDSINPDDIKTINDAFNSEARYKARNSDGPTFNFLPIGDLLKSSKKIEWLVDGLFTVGGLSIIVGAPKSGKSTLVRQLAKSVARGEKFLNRNTKPGKVIILALEEQAEVLNVQFKQLGVNNKDDILIHTGRIVSDNATEDLHMACLDFRPALIIVDTLMLFCKTQNINDYTEMNNKLEELRDLARKTGAQVVCIHHQNKSRENFGTATILGSAAIHGAVDCAMIFNKNGYRRSIQTSQRAGKPFENEELIFDEKTQTYAVGKKMQMIDEEF